MRWYLDVLRRYARFDGRAGRDEFWWFSAWSTAIAVALTVIEMGLGLGNDYWGPLSAVYLGAVCLPSVAVGTRRLHDIGRSGRWQLLILVPFAGWIVLMAWWTRDGDDPPNAWGPKPWDGLDPAT